MKELTLIQNAEDSLQHALTHIKPSAKSGIHDWKRVILDLSHVLELILKERLRKEHPAFVFTKVDSWQSKDAHTVNIDLAIKRIESFAKIIISKEDKDVIKDAQDKRNEITHYEFSLTEEDFKRIAGKILGFILRFSQEQLDLDWYAKHGQEANWAELIRFKDFYDDLSNTVKKRIEKEELPVIECPDCYEETFHLEEQRCMICRYTEEVSQCITCKDDYLASTCEDEESPLCSSCLWNEGYAAAHCERC